MSSHHHTGPTAASPTSQNSAKSAGHITSSTGTRVSLGDTKWCKDCARDTLRICPCHVASTCTDTTLDPVGYGMATMANEPRRSCTSLTRSCAGLPCVTSKNQPASLTGPVVMALSVSGSARAPCPSRRSHPMGVPGLLPAVNTGSVTPGMSSCMLPTEA